MTTDRLIGTFIISIVIYSCLVAALRAEDTSLLGRVGRFGIPLNAPSPDTAEISLVVGEQVYKIPRNYVFVVEKSNPRTQIISVISMRLLMPKYSGFTKQHADCFLKFTVPCSADIVTVGITRGLSVPGSRKIWNLRNLIYPDKRIGACGFEYFADRSPTERTGQSFAYFIQRQPEHSELVVLRCPKEGATSTSHCNASENIGDGNSLYYVFHRNKLCEWPVIRREIFNLMDTFKREDDYECHSSH